MLLSIEFGIFKMDLRPMCTIQSLVLGICFYGHWNMTILLQETNDKHGNMFLDENIIKYQLK